MLTVFVCIRCRILASFVAWFLRKKSKLSIQVGRVGYFSVHDVSVVVSPSLTVVLMITESSFTDLLAEHVVTVSVQLFTLSSVLRPRRHSIGYMGDSFYRLKDPTNSIKVLKVHIIHRQIKHTIIRQ